METAVDHAYPEDVREVFGWFGAAYHNAQFFEGDLVTLQLTVAGRNGAATTLSKLNDLEALHSRKTLGQLIATLRKVEPVPIEVENLWQRALELRNDLSHGFFWKRHARLMNPAACGELVEELKRAANLFSDASDAARQLVERSIITLGIDRGSWRQTVEDELHRLYKNSNGA